MQRGFGALGYTMQLPFEDRYLMTRTDLLHQLSVLLAGRTAEEIALGEISTGAQNDLQRASDIARAMVTEFGMSDSVGAINYAAQKRSRFLDVGMPNDSGPYAEETAQLIDREVKRMVGESHAVARRILNERRATLEAVTRRLLEKEVMEGDELRAIMAETADATAATEPDHGTCPSLCNGPRSGPTRQAATGNCAIYLSFLSRSLACPPRPNT